MNSPSLSPICRSVTVALAFAAVLLSVGCSTMTSAAKNDSDNSKAYAENYGELHRMMAKLAAESDQKVAAQPEAATASIASSQGLSGVLASNP